MRHHFSHTSEWTKTLTLEVQHTLNDMTLNDKGESIPCHELFSFFIRHTQTLEDVKKISLFEVHLIFHQTVKTSFTVLETEVTYWCSITCSLHSEFFSETAGIRSIISKIRSFSSPSDTFHDPVAIFSLTKCTER